MQFRSNIFQIWHAVILGGGGGRKFANMLLEKYLKEKLVITKNWIVWLKNTTLSQAHITNGHLFL